MKRIVLAIGGALALLAAVVVVRAARLQPAPKAPPAHDLLAVDREAAAHRLAGAVRIPTISYGDRSAIDYSQLSRLHGYLAAQFPRVHAELRRETVARYSLLYTWEGSDARARPILLLAHQDVVPVEPGTEKSWEQPPFSGAIAGGFVWGRGALDDKSSLVAQLEAVELLLAKGFKPRRTIYFAFGHDEEIGGEQGATAVAALLARRGVKAEFSLDEGGVVTRGVVAGVDVPVASVMTAEKGYLSLRLTTHDAGGHSSQPPPVSAVGRLAHAVARVQDQLLPVHLAAPVTDMLDALAPAMKPGLRLAMANRWLLGPLIEHRLTQSPVTSALVRTTTAPTMFNAGIKDNVLPSHAVAVVNFRILPGESIASVTAHVREAVGDPQVTIEPLDFASEPSPVSGTGTAGFAAIARTVNELFPDAVVTPGLVVGATDNRHYGAVRDDRYNFAPGVLQPGDFERVHGANERVGIDDYVREVQFYARLLQNVAG